MEIFKIQIYLHLTITGQKENVKSPFVPAMII